MLLKRTQKICVDCHVISLHLGHLRNMVSITQQGAIICPAVPAFYTKPKTIEDIIDYSVGRILGSFDIEVVRFKTLGRVKNSQVQFQ